MMPASTEISRQRILDAAAAAFSEVGYDATTMEEIARRSKRTRMTVYNLFGSKEAIARELIDLTGALTEQVFRRRIETNEDAVTLLNQALLASARWSLANPSLAQFALTASPDPDSLRPSPRRPSFHAVVRDMTALGQRQGVIRTDEDANDLALVLLGSFAQALQYALRGGAFDERRIDWLVRLLIQGLGAQPGSEAGGKS